jgi:2,4-dienoyl-CoA reductase-like NADH-dependent reductase (Old Yellow Enzyme family)
MNSPLSQPLTLPCGVSLPNRLVKAAMTEGLADPQNRATKAHETLYRRWAEGGSGVLITGNVQIDRNYLERPGNVVIQGSQSEDQLDGLRAWASSVTQTGTHIWMQISHAGRQTPASVTKEPVAPSEVEVKLPGGQFGKPRALTADEVENLAGRFAAAAVVAKETGFSGVQIHAAHGYLISEFLSPLVNKRQDKWGGSLENRARLLLDVVQKTRAKVGPDYPISVKLNSTDFQKGGFSFEECLQVVEWLGEASVDCLEISGGSYEQPKMMGSDGLEPAFEEGERESTRQREAYFMKYAAEIRKVAQMPLMVTGGFRTKEAMVEAIEEDGIALIGLARPLCVETDSPQQLLSGQIQTLPDWEKKLRLGPGIFGVNSSIKLFKMLNVIGIQSWFCLQLLKMGSGQSPDPSLGLFKALRQYQSSETKAAKALIRP